MELIYGSMQLLTKNYSALDGMKIGKVLVQVATYNGSLHVVVALVFIEWYMLGNLNLCELIMICSLLLGYLYVCLFFL